MSEGFGLAMNGVTHTTGVDDRGKECSMRSVVVN